MVNKPTFNQIEYYKAVMASVLMDSDSRCDVTIHNIGNQVGFEYKVHSPELRLNRLRTIEEKLKKEIERIVEYMVDTSNTNF